jgi:hypothetical protein
LRWIRDELDRMGIPFQAVGGLAVRAHGGTRPLVDLDFYIPERHLDSVARALAAHVVRPPSEHRDEHWDLTFMILEHAGWRIEIAGAESARVRDRGTGGWVPAGIGFDRSVQLILDGVAIPVIPLSELLAYKKGLDREVDRADLAELAPSAPGDQVNDGSGGD